jgi:hypothetical protein
MKRVDSTIAEECRLLLARALADAIPEELRRWRGQSASWARVPELRARFATVWDAYMPEVSDRTQAQRWMVSEGLAASVCGYLVTPAEASWDEENATIEAQQVLHRIMGAEVDPDGLLLTLTPGALFAVDVMEEWLLWIGTWRPHNGSPEADPHGL